MRDRGTRFFVACIAASALVVTGIFLGDRMAHTVAPGRTAHTPTRPHAMSLVISADVELKLPSILNSEMTQAPHPETLVPAVPIRSPASTGLDHQAIASGFGQHEFKSLQAQLPSCLHEGYTTGHWVRNSSVVSLPYVSKGILSVCLDEFQRHYGQTRRRKGRHGKLDEDESPPVPLSVQYQWVPREPCRLTPWSRETFCRALAGRSILIAGDSLNDHWHASLLWLLGSDFDVYRREGSNWGKINCYGHPICEEYWRPITSDGGEEGGPPDVMRTNTNHRSPFLRVDPSSIQINRTSMRGPLLRFATNQLLRNVSFQHKKANRNQEWWKELRGADIVILNAGSWMVDPADKSHAVSEQEYEDIMDAAVRVLKNASFNGTVIWRTTYSGHPNCWDYREPLRNELTNDELNKDPKYRSYGWARIRRRNEIATRIWKGAGAHILDVAPITNLMPLGHLAKNHPDFASKGTTDCLHYCSPGPVYDTWSMLLMNLLLGNIT